MADISAAVVRQLREQTGIGLMDCKKALQETDGDLDQAVDYLRKQGMAAVEKRAGRDALEGLVTSYIHPGNRLGVLVEVNCETDFVARTDDFQQFAKDVAMHIAAEQPRAVDRDSIAPMSSPTNARFTWNRRKTKGNPTTSPRRSCRGALKNSFRRSASWNNRLSRTATNRLKTSLRK